MRIGHLPRAYTTAVWLQLLVAVVASGCGFRTLKQDLEVAEKQAAIEGRADMKGGGDGSIIVSIHTVAGGEMVDYFILARPGPFLFVLPAGNYQLAAFDDRNRNLVYEPESEPAVLADTHLGVAAGDRRRDIVLSIDPSSDARLPYAINAASPKKRQLHQFPAPKLDEVIGLDDPRFSRDNADLGLWDPLKFLFTVGAGVYFLEEFAPEKIPVLFVHGALGTPADWTFIVENLDRDRFQPWFFYYPSAPHLERIAQGLVRALSALQVRYQFDEMILVAHSMGGLVTRAAVNYVMQNVSTHRVVRIPAFISISSPWNGHTAAAMGVEYAPVVAPMWEDMAPDSAFLKALPETALPPECEHTLLFSYRGRGSEANDGTVTLASQLSLPIQRKARQVMGFDETHTSILRNAEVSAKVNTILAAAAETKPPLPVRGKGDTGG